MNDFNKITHSVLLKSALTGWRAGGNELCPVVCGVQFYRGISYLTMTTSACGFLAAFAAGITANAEWNID